MNVLLYRRSLRLKSGAGQLLRMQALALRERGARVLLGGERGVLDFRLRTRLPVRRMTAAAAAARTAEPDWIVADHDLRLPHAHVVFVHNLMSVANVHVQRPELEPIAAREAAFFAGPARHTLVVANSALVRRALLERFALEPARVEILYPGYDAARFSRQRAALLRARARRALGIEDGTLAIGFVTSGDLHKRGLDLFLDSASEIARAVPACRFLIAGGSRLPDWARAHPLVASGRALYRPKTRRPEPWYAALDLFLYAARFEEYGLVVAEALACGLPVLTSRRVGAAECLPPDYEPWLLERPESGALAAHAIALCRDAETRAALGAAGAAAVRRFDADAYRAASLRLLLPNR